MLAPRIRKIDVSRKVCACPVCGYKSKRHRNNVRRLCEIGIDRPVVLEVRYSAHYCLECRKHFSVPLDHLAKLGAHYTNRVVACALAVLKDGMTLKVAVAHMLDKYFVKVPPTTIHEWYSLGEFGERYK